VPNDKLFSYPVYPEWLNNIQKLGTFDPNELARLRASASFEESLAELQALPAILEGL